MDRKQAEKVADALLEPGRRRQAEQRQSRLLRQWRGAQFHYRNRRALLLAGAATAAGAVAACAGGVLTLEALAAPETWTRLLAWVGLPGWLVGLWWFRPPPRPAHLEEL
ncbi:MAG TPA: hypothetical protein VFF91_01055 [Pseudoxanthomonas sp.]|nr:hypothetical protein [Pseudoxanthomonas sp.]